VATVSRALNDSPLVTPETKHLISEVAGKMGYSLPSRRPGPKPGKPSRRRKVALINFLDRYHVGIDTPSTFLSLQRGVNSGVRDHGVLVDLHVLSTDTELPETIRDGSYCGFLLLGRQPHASIEDFLRKQPCCWVMSNPWTPTWGDHVMPDHREAGMIAARYLMERGCKYPAVIKLGQLDRVQALRTEGFVYAASLEKIKTHALTAKKALSGERLSYPEVVYVDEVVEGIKKMNPQPDGFYMDNDRSVATLYTVMVREKLIVPGKTGLIGCDNQTQYLKGISPYPATIEVHFEQIGRIGVSQLLWRIRNPDCQRVRSLISPTLISLS
jgi:LacI family transcriptional regulator